MKKETLETLYNKILEDINSNKIIDETGKIMSEYKMMDRYSSSRYSVRQVLNKLSKRGVIYKKQGVGSFLRPNQSKVIINLQDDNISLDIFDFYFENKNIPVMEDNLIVSKACFLPKSIILPQELKLFEINNLKISNGIPICYEIIYYVKNNIKNISNKNLYRNNYDILNNSEKFGIEIGIIDKFISSEPLDFKSAKFLNAKPETPTLVIRRDIFLKSGELLGFAKEIFDYRSIELYMSISY